MQEFFGELIPSDNYHAAIAAAMQGHNPESVASIAGVSFAAAERFCEGVAIIRSTIARYN